MAAFLLVTFYVTMAASGLAVELLFQALGIVPTDRDADVVEASVTLNYTTVLNIVFLLLAAVLVWRYFTRGGGLRMLRMMNEPMDHHHHDHAHRTPRPQPGAQAISSGEQDLGLRLPDWSTATAQNLAAPGAIRPRHERAQRAVLAGS